MWNLIADAVPRSSFAWPAGGNEGLSNTRMVWLVVAVAALMLFWKFSLLFEILSRAQEGRTGGVSLMPTVDLGVGGAGTGACVLGDMSPLGGLMASLGLVWGPSIIFFGALAVGSLVSRKRGS
jgi:hypothetical protein